MVKIVKQIEPRLLDQKWQSSSSELGVKLLQGKGSLGKPRNTKGHNRNLVFWSLRMHVNNACHYRRNEKNISHFLAKNKELIKEEIIKMSNEVLPTSVSGLKAKRTTC